MLTLNRLDSTKINFKKFNLFGINSFTPHLKQERFLLRKRNDSTDSIIYPWWVPLTYTSDFTQAAKRDWLTVGQISKPLTNLGIAAHQWVIFNVEQRSECKELSMFATFHHSLLFRLLLRRCQLRFDPRPTHRRPSTVLLITGLNFSMTRLI